MATQGKVFVIIEGGRVQDVFLDVPEELGLELELIIIDHDQEGADDDEHADYEAAVKELEEASGAVSLMFQ